MVARLRKEGDKTTSQAHRKGTLGITEVEEGVGIMPLHRKTLEITAEEEAEIEGAAVETTEVEIEEEAVETTEAEEDAKAGISGQQMMSGLTIISLRMISKTWMRVKSQTRANSLRKTNWLTTNTWRMIRLCKIMLTQTTCWKAIQGELC
jgi:hypothetical protein